MKNLTPDKKMFEFYKQRTFRAVQERSTGWTPVELQVLYAAVQQWCQKNEEPGARRLIFFCHSWFRETKSLITIRHGIRLLDRGITDGTFHYQNESS